MSLSKKILVASVCSCLVTSAVIVSPLSLFTPLAQAQTRRVRYVPPSNLDAPKTSASGITRSSGCTIACLIALLPDLEVDKSPVPQSISERPTIYFLSPKYRGEVKFQLYKDTDASAKDNLIYQTKFDINNEAGIIAFKLPDDAPVLEVGKIYTWNLTFQSVYEYKKVHGSMRRVLPNKKLTEQLSKLSNPIDRAALLAQEGIWFETLTSLAEAQQTVPKNPEVIDEWNAILKSANLDRVLPYSFVSQK